MGATSAVGSYAWHHIALQTAVDNAAKTLASVQAFQFNRIEMITLAGSVEEYRIRSLIDGAFIAGQGNGGCALSTSCRDDFQALSKALVESVNRYTKLLNLANQAMYGMDLPSLKSNISSVLTVMSDPTFSITYNQPGLQRPYLYYALHMDTTQNPLRGYVGTAQACDILGQTLPQCFVAVGPRMKLFSLGDIGLTPPYSQYSTFAPSLRTNTTFSPIIADFWNPLKVEISACDDVQLGPLLPQMIITAHAAAEPEASVFMARNNSAFDNFNCGSSCIDYFPKESWAKGRDQQWDWYDPNWQTPVGMWTTGDLMVWFSPILVQPTYNPITRPRAGAKCDS